MSSTGQVGVRESCGGMSSLPSAFLFHSIYCSRRSQDLPFVVVCVCFFTAYHASLTFTWLNRNYPVVVTMLGTGKQLHYAFLSLWPFLHFDVNWLTLVPFIESYIPTIGISHAYCITDFIHTQMPTISYY